MAVDRYGNFLTPMDSAMGRENGPPPQEFQRERGSQMDVYRHLKEALFAVIGAVERGEAKAESAEYTGVRVADSNGIIRIASIKVTFDPK